MTTRCFTALALALALSALAPLSADAQTRDPSAPGAFDLGATPRAVHRVDRGLVVAGATTLSLAWGANTVGALIGTMGLEQGSFDEGLMYGLSFIPAVGPFLFGGLALSTESSGLRDLIVVSSFVDGAVQALGLGLLIAGLVGVDEPVPEVAEGLWITPVASSSFTGAMFQMEL